jgi:hypothetical protein
MVAQALKRYARRRVVGVLRRVVCGTEAEVGERLRATQGAQEALINTAYIERLQATFRSRLAPLVRKTRATARQRATLETGMWLVGTVYNFCRAAMDRTNSRSSGGAHLFKGWSLYELLSFAVPPASVPKRRGRRPKWLLEAAHAA